MQLRAPIGQSDLARIHELSTMLAVTCGSMTAKAADQAAVSYGPSEVTPHVWTSDRGDYSQICVVDALSEFAGDSDTAVWIKGYASVAGRELSSCAEYVLERYRRLNALPIDDLEGSFAVAVHDRPKARILIYRNIAGAVDVFYSAAHGEFRYATNLAQLLGSSTHDLQLNEDLLPVFFLYRCLPGHETLYKGAARVLAGDLLVYEAGAISHRKVRTFDQLRGSIKVDEDVVGQLDATIGTAVKDCVRTASTSAMLLSGGVDSTLLQSHWNQCVGSENPRTSYCATLNHPRTIGEYDYARTSAAYLNTRLVGVSVDRPYLDYLDAVIADTAETPNHVQAAYFPILAETMREAGVTTGICGEAGDGLFGIATQYELQIAVLLRTYLPSTVVRRSLKALCVGRRGRNWESRLELSNRLDDMGYLLHPINQQASFAHLESVLKCFGHAAIGRAMEYRRDLIAANGLVGSYVAQLHAANLLTSSINSASFWNTLFGIRGARLFSPFLDSRVVRLAMCIDDQVKYEFGKPKQLVKEALSRRTTRELAFRRKLSFGQPIFEWLSVGGQLRPAVDEIDRYDFVDEETLANAKAAPNWFLYNLLCFDRLNKLVLAN